MNAVMRSRVAVEWIGMCVLALGGGFLTPLPAEGQESWSVSVYPGFAAPVGDFGDEMGDDAGLAQMGFLLGVGVTVPIHPAPGLGWLSSVEGVTFGVDEDFVSELSLAVPEASIDIGRYWGGLLFTGLAYETTVTPGLDVFALGQLAAGFLRAPGATISVFGETAELTTSWKPAKGVSGGVGAVVDDRFLIEARLVHLIDTEVEGELTYQGLIETLEGEQPITWLQVTAGVRIH